MSDTPKPTSLVRLAEDRLRIEWSDGQATTHTAAKLRRECPCATCREQRDAPPPPATQLPVLSAAEAAPLAIRGMRPVGAYAYNIAFSDGHDSGLFTLERLRALGEEEAAVD